MAKSKFSSPNIMKRNKSNAFEKYFNFQNINKNIEKTTKVRKLLTRSDCVGNLGVDYLENSKINQSEYKESRLLIPELLGANLHKKSSFGNFKIRAHSISKSKLETQDRPISVNENIKKSKFCLKTMNFPGRKLSMTTFMQNTLIN